MTPLVVSWCVAAAFNLQHTLFSNPSLLPPLHPLHNLMNVAGGEKRWRCRNKDITVPSGRKGQGGEGECVFHPHNYLSGPESTEMCKKGFSELFGFPPRVYILIPFSHGLYICLAIQWNSYTVPNNSVDFWEASVCCWNLGLSPASFTNRRTY